MGTASSSATTLRYYQMFGSTPSELTGCARSVGPLAPSATSILSCLVSLPATPGTYYFAAAVDPVPGELITSDNYYFDVEVTVTSTSIPTYPLTVTRVGTGGGTVTGTGINCGSDCAESYPSGTSVSLTATASVGTVFMGWSGACSGFGTQGTCTLSMNAAKSATATFKYIGAGSDYSRDYVQKAYVAYYGRPADPSGQSYWAGRMDAEGQSLNAIIGAFGYSDEFNRRFGGLTFAELVTKIFQQALGRNPDPAGLNWYVNELLAGRRTLQTITLDVLNGATTAPDSTVVANKLAVAAYYTTKVAAGCPYGTEQDGVDVVTIVTALAGSVAAAEVAIDAGCGP